MNEQSSFDSGPLDAAVRELRTSLRAQPAPPELEAKLRAAFRQSFEPRPARSRTRSAALGLAAVLLLGLALATFRRSPPQRRPGGPVAQPEVVTDFFPLAYGPTLAPGDPMQVIRVRIQIGRAHV